MGTLIHKALNALSDEFERDARSQLNDTRRRVLDLIVTPGMIAGKVQEDGGKTLRCELSVPVIDDSRWDEVIRRCADDRSTSALLLAGVVPDRLTEALAECEERLVPGELRLFSGKCECQSKTRCRHLLTLIAKFIERAGEESFLILSFRGIGREELIKRLIDAAHTDRNLVAETMLQDLSYNNPSAVEKVSLQQFWKCAPEMFSLTYAIRADELPAALLKRLDSVPVSEVSDDADMRFESAYEQIARRAQAFGLSLRKT